MRTPGPLQIFGEGQITLENCETHNVQVITDSKNEELAYVYDEPLANLIAAAPDLLEALKLARVWMVGSPEDHDDDAEHTRVIELIADAIAKAEGRN